MQEQLRRLVSLCALLHDVDDWKYCSVAAEGSLKRSIAFLRAQAADQAVIDAVTFVLGKVGFKESLKKSEVRDGDADCSEPTHSETAELVLSIVQDADRLDALGKFPAS